MNRLLQPIAASRRRSSGFSPSDLSPALWLDANDSTTLFDATSGGSTPANGGTVRRWEDKSANARHVTEATNAPTRQTGVQNSRDVVRFASASTQRLGRSSTSEFNFLHDGTVHWVFFVAKFGNSTDPGFIHPIYDTNGIASASVGASLGYDDRSGTHSDAIRHFISRGVPSNSTVDNAPQNIVTPQSFVVVSVKADPSNTTALSRSDLRVNVSDVTDTNSLDNAPVSSNASNGILIGASSSPNAFYLDGDIAELIIVSGDLTTQQRDDCESYLQTKWLPT